MKIAIIGYGAMGQLIETLAKNKGHEIVAVVDENDASLSVEELAEKLKLVDVAIDFSIAEAVKKNVEDVLAGLYDGDVDMNRVTATIDKPLHGANLEAHLNGLRDEMRKAAENLEFEEAARLRDEVKRLETVDLAISDDPMARQSVIETAVSDAQKASGRSTAGRPGQRGGVKPRRKRG